jgi:hypothetical protein
MIAGTLSRNIARFPRWSSTGNATARPASCPAWHISLDTSLKYRDRTTHSMPTSQSGILNHTIHASQRPLSTRRAAVKSP